MKGEEWTARSQPPPRHSWQLAELWTTSAISSMVKCGHSFSRQVCQQGVDPCPRQGGIQGTRGQEARGPWEAGSGPLCPPGCLTPKPHRGTGQWGTPAPHLPPAIPGQDNPEPAPTWYLCFPGSLALAPRAPTDTSWELQGDRVSWQPAGTGTWGCGPPSRGGSQRVHRAVLFSWKWICIGSHSLALPLAGGISRAAGAPHGGCHVTVYSSSRWFLQIS